ncbi:hypothetical protein C8R43DRAFT_967277 [Mycena crocata]|nr:hypothetical protein C8R43DRAFT_967277 [Mycena crocata]
MSTNKSLPSGVSFQRNKRRREHSADDESLSSRPNPVMPSGSQEGTAGMPRRSTQWQRILDDLAANGQSVPPPAVAAKFYDIYSAGLTRYKSTQTALQRAQSTLSKFGQVSSNGAIPSSVSNHLKLPLFQPIQLAADAVSDERVVDAKKAAEKDIATALQSSVKLLTTFYEVQVETCRNMLDVATCADAYANALTEYGKSIMTASGDADIDVNVWQTCITRLKVAFTLEIKNLKYDFTARTMSEAEAKEAKANAVLTARADAEMADATRPIGEMLDEKVVRAVAEEMERQKPKKKAKIPPSDGTSSTSKAPPPKPGATRTSSSTGNGGALRIRKKAETAKGSKSKEVKTGRVSGAVGTGRKEKSATVKGKAKAAAGVVETPDSDSD